MKTLMRHGLAVCLALTTMCTSLLLVYSSLGGQKERPPQQQQQQQQQQQAAATGSAQPSAESSPPSRPRAPAGPQPLDGYLGVADHKPLKMHCRDCALVTSSGHLLRSRQGPQIDQTECVIRMNDAPTRGYGRDVGNRTSLRVIAHSSIQRILRNRHDLLNVSQGTVFIFWGPSSYMRRDGKGQVYNNLQLLSQVLPRLKAFMITRHKMLQVDELFKRETGKDRDPNHPSVPYHYYEPFGPDECTMYLSHERGRKGSHHRFITEKRVFKNWARTFNIHFFQPDWKPESLAITHPENKPVF
ncbi:alpha-N-acetylgalactosaminide alpha-2,6-sialyltransferase 5 isoform X2 [Diceros bicornis minor]|uniref:alpha-N-acetylgalactosaminide alpha-2,6-sialyltransferase 5 isoform X2 n=1 Tax=Diceros bicornis minor TaxID=77932 RepID=UPI0026F19AB1|nr:alpha-N-acetylgalactosaminide alpha-2,6-sialyltransferase 5 isoform X2 [Diceros bicornis minor]